MTIINAILFTLGNGIAFNLVLPFFAAVIEIARLLGLM